MEVTKDQKSLEHIVFPVSEDYIQLSLKTSSNSQRVQNQLLILDLNGTLCSRTTTKSFYTRPHSQEFFDFIFKNFAVMVWSSAQESSVSKMCKMFEPYKPSIVWHRGHLGLSHEDFYNNVKSVKNLEKVWAAYPPFNATNTIVLDDTPSKLCAQRYNLVLMRTFDHVTFLSQMEGERDLRKVIQYLTQVQFQTNVCNFMRFLPFNATLEWEVVPDPIADTSIGQFVNGINVKPSAERRQQIQTNKFGQAIDECIMTAKRQEMKARKKDKRVAKKLEKRNVKLANVIKDNAQAINNTQTMNNMQSIDIAQIINTQVDTLPEILTTNGEAVDVEEPEASDEGVEADIPEMKGEVMNETNKGAIKVDDIETNQDMSIMNEPTDLIEKVLPNPFRSAYNNAFPPASPPEISHAIPPTTLKPKKSKKSKKSIPRPPQPKLQRITILPPANAIPPPPSAKPLKSILKPPKDKIRILPGAKMTLKQRTKLENHFTFKKEVKRLRQQKKNDNLGV